MKITDLARGLRCGGRGESGSCSPAASSSESSPGINSELPTIERISVRRFSFGSTIFLWLDYFTTEAQRTWSSRLPLRNPGKQETVRPTKLPGFLASLEGLSVFSVAPWFNLN